jgi:hypothetical protein
MTECPSPDSSGNPFFGRFFSPKKDWNEWREIAPKKSIFVYRFQSIRRVNE